jgi:hypothetical protein
MDWVSPQAQEIARLKAETAMVQKKRYRGLVGIGFGGAGLACALVGMPMIVSIALWGVGLAAWAIIKAA